MILMLDHHLSSRQESVQEIKVLEIVDLTNDGNKDVLFADTTNNKLFVISNASGFISIHPIPEQCQGSWVVSDHDKYNRVEIIRNGCQTNKRASYGWNGYEFALKSTDN